MVITRSAGLSEGQKTRLTVKIEGASNKDDLQAYVLETQFEAQPSPTGNDQLDDERLHNTSQNGPNKTPNNFLNKNPVQKDETALVQEKQDKQPQINKKISLLHTSKSLANSRQELACLRNKKAQEFPMEDDIGSKTFKQQLTMEQTKSVQEPDVYLE